MKQVLEIEGLEFFQFFQKAANRASLHGLDIGGYKFRQEYIRKFGFAIPTPEALQTLANLGPIVEIGAGLGYWAYLLRQMGVEVKAFDHKVPGTGQDNSWWPDRPTWTEVLQGGPEKAALYPGHTLFLCWPYMDSMAADALEAYTAAGGTNLVYIGETALGCTADKRFFQMLDEYVSWNDDEEEQVVQPLGWKACHVDFRLPTWDGIHDDFYAYKRV